MENKVSFRTFTEKEFEEYIKLAIKDYANSLFKGGYSTKEKSDEDSTCQFNELLPEIIIFMSLKMISMKM